MGPRITDTIITALFGARRLWLALLLAPLLLLARPAAAESPLTLAEVLGSLERTHPDLEVAARGVDKAAGAAFAARGGFDPTLALRAKWAPVGYYPNGQVDAIVTQATPLWGTSLFAGYRLGWGSFPVYKGELATLSGGELRAGVELPIWRGGPIDARRAKIQAARLREGGARRGRDAVQLELEREASYAFWDWVAAGQQLQVARALLEIAERRDAGLQELARAGAIEPIKLVDNRRLVLDRRAKVIGAAREFEQRAIKLSLYLRDDERRPVRVGEGRVPPGFPAPRGLDQGELEAEIERALQRRPDLEALTAERDAAAVSVRLARNQRAPDIKLQSYVARDLGDGPDELRPTEWGAGVYVAMPLPLREARGELRVAQAELAAVEAKRRGLRDKIGAEIRAAHVAVEAAARRVALAREQIAAAEQLAEAERTRLAAGASDLVIVNLREQAAADAARELIDAHADLERARADFLVATGRSPA